jgi:phytoene desaturase
MSKKIAIIGSGISGLSAACYLARDGHTVEVFEKNSTVGGRCRAYSEGGFTFDMGPSWYWMPDVFEKFYNDFGKTTSDFYDLVKLDPGFQVFFGKDDVFPVPADINELYKVFEGIESGSAAQLKKYLEEAEWKYRTGMQLAYKPALSWTEFANLNVLASVVRTDMLKPMSNYVRKFFKNDRLIKLMEFPVLFLGAMPDNIPALYSLMNHAALSQGTYYPMGGMYRLPDAMKQIADSMGVRFHMQESVAHIQVASNHVTEIITDKSIYEADSVVAACDYHHTEQMLLEKEYRNYNKMYWESRVMAPSCLIYYIGVSKKIDKLKHHNLFFDSDFDNHAREIYDNPQWPSNPMFYVCAPGKTDRSVAPEGMENLFLLVPVAPGLEDDEYKRVRYFHSLVRRMEQVTGEDILPHIVYKKSYCINDFRKDYNAFKGNAYGLANTLGQTAILKPRMANRKIKNLFYAGQLTVPGPGVPPAIISGQIAAGQVAQHFKAHSYESTIR